MTDWRILITGSRDLSNIWLVDEAICSQIAGKHGQIRIVQGGCPTGADLFAGMVVDRIMRFTRDRALWDLVLETHPADWVTHGMVAGPLRNQAMVDSGADLCLAFYKQGAGNRGTKDCVRRARAAGIPVIEHTEVGE